MIPDEKSMCHHTAFEKRCIDVVVNCKCRKWVRLTGTDKDTGKPVDVYDCADHWQPQISQQATAQLSEQLTMVAKSVDALRAEVQAANHQGIAAGMTHLNTRLVDALNAIGGPPPDMNRLLE